MVQDPLPKIPKWPFVIGDIVLVAAAAVIVYRSATALKPVEDFLLVLSVGLGAWLCAVPFLVDHRAKLKALETNELTGAIDRIKAIELIAAQIHSATGQWQTVQEQAMSTAGSVREISDRMTNEARAFVDFVRKANDTEKAHLKVELEKLRRFEGEWINVIVGLLDQIYALNRAAAQSGHANVIEQIGNFQNVCLDISRRVGFVPLMPAAGAGFDPAKHSTIDGRLPESDHATVAETLAPGYTFQSQLLRRPIVRVEEGSADRPDPSSPPDFHGALPAEITEETRMEKPADSGRPDETLLL